MHTDHRGKPLLAITLMLCLGFAAATVSEVMARQGQKQQTQGPQIEAAPAGWVNVGYDFDNDGIFEAYEVISIYELQKSQAQRQQSRKSLGQRKNFFEQSSFLEPEKTTADRIKKGALKGRIKAMADVGIVNSNGRNLLAKVETEGGTIATVDLGPLKDLKQLDLQEGDVIKVYGVQGTIDQKAVLVANSLQVSGERMKIDRSKVRPLKKFQAKVLKTREVSHRGKTNLLARVELEDGLKTIVNFGPAADLPVLAEGQQIQFLARITEVEGKKALIAERLRTKGANYLIDWQRVQKNQGESKA